MSFLNRHFFVGMFFGAVVLAIIGIGGLGAFAVAMSSFMEGGRQLEAPFGDVPEFPTDPAAPPALMAWALTSLDGEETYLGEFGDAVVFVNNWATWCAPCVREMPSIESLAERYQGKSLAFVIVSTEPLSLVRDFVEEKGWNLPVFVAEHRPPIFQTKGIPSTFVLTQSPHAQNLQVAFSHVGGANWDAPQSHHYFDRLLSRI